MKISSRKAASIFAAALLGAGLLPASPAHAASLACDSDAHCVGADGARTGLSGGACWASAGGPAISISTKLTCSTGFATATVTGGSFVFTTVSGPVLQMCWTAESTFLLASGQRHIVSTSGCELISEE